MGFFKDFKEDFSQAVNELVPGEDSLDGMPGEDEVVVNTLEDEVDVATELSKLDGLLEHVAEPKQEAPRQAAEPDSAPMPIQEEIPVPSVRQPAEEPMHMAAAENKPEAPAPELAVPEFIKNANAQNHAGTQPASMTQEERKMADNTVAPAVNQEKIISDEVSVITEGTIIKGDVISNGSLDIRGQVNGNVACNGKLTVTGVINGNSNTSEFFADAAQVEGEVVSSGTVKIGLGSVIIGNVSSSSAVIAGAIKGDIDVQGPVVVDTSAVVMGNIKSRSVQINNGAVIEGFCSQCYSDVDVQSLFDGKKGSQE